MKKNFIPLFQLLLIIIGGISIVVISYLIMNYRVEVIVGHECGILDTIYYSWIYGLGGD